MEQRSRGAQQEVIKCTGPVAFARRQLIGSVVKEYFNEYMFYSGVVFS